MSSDFRPRKRIKNPDALKRFRLEMLGEPCERCELRPGSEVHHEQFRSQGGDDVPANLWWLCRHCHSGIHDGRVGRYDLG